jgi:ribosomal protein S20
MANTSSSKKAIRTAERKKKINDARRDALRKARVDLRKAITKKTSKKDLTTLLQQLYKSVDKAAKGGKVLHPNKASRIKSQATKAVANK